MIRKFAGFVLRSRLEDVMAIGFSIALIIFFSITRMFHSFEFGLLDILFIMLPVGILVLKALFTLLVSSETNENEETAKYLANFFKPFLKIIRDWFPFVLLCSCYYALFDNLVLKVNSHLADATLAKIDAFILGTQPSFLLEPFIRSWLTDFMNLIYFSHIFVFPGVALYFYLKKEQHAFRHIMMGFLTIMLMGTLTYILVPASGPEKLFADRYTHDLQGVVISHTVNYIINTGRVSFDCFPSLHVGIPLLLSFYIRKYRRKWFIPMLVYVALMCFATIYLRYHYLIDVIASFVYAPAAYYLNNFLLRHWPGEQAQRLVQLVGANGTANQVEQTSK